MPTKTLVHCIVRVLLPLLALAGLGQPAAAQTAPRPNIALIVSDDQGWKDVGFHGSDIATPNLDTLVAGGARLESYYAQPMCTPSRAALMSGRYPHRYGLQSAKQPFFLYLAFTAPHAPYQAPNAWLDRYAHIPDRDRRAYAAMISAMDEQIGRVVATLDAKGLRDNTLIVFQSDNGGPRDARFTGEVDMSESTIPADNGPWRDGKGSLYEGGVRVVALASWPGRIPAGTVVDTPLHAVDLMPTFAKLAGASLNGAKPLDGLDRWPALAEGQPSARREVVIDVEPLRAALRDGDWKLVWQATLPSRVELYDLKTDPGEKNNLAAAQPERVARMQARLEAQAKEAAPPLFFKEAVGVAKPVLFGSVATPDDVKQVERQP